jgi:N6-L-threonylcarbamoyladenine synthase
MSIILALETSCDETAVAVLRGRELLASEIASQTVHEQYGGVVPEVASRNHLVHAPGLLRSALETAGIAVSEVDAFAATSGPGLATSLMIGASIAKGLAIAAGKPYLAINHLEGHLLSPFFDADESVQPNVSLVVSGGKSAITEFSAAPSTTRPAKHSTKWQRCSGLVIPAGRRSNAARVPAMRQGSISRAACSGPVITISASAA